MALDDTIDCIRFTGGPTHSAIWMQMFCDASNLPLEIVDIQQSGCRAAALCAAVGSHYYHGFEEAIRACPPLSPACSPMLKTSAITGAF